MYIFKKASEYIDKMPKEEFEKKKKIQKIITTARNEEMSKAKQREDEVIDANLWQNRETVVNKMEQCTSESEL